MGTYIWSLIFFQQNKYQTLGFPKQFEYEFENEEKKGIIIK